MAQCYELLATPRSPPSSLSTYGYPIYPVNVDPAGCMAAAPQNPDGMPIVGHFIGFNSDEYIAFAAQPTLQDVFNTPLTGDLQQMWMLGFATPLIAYLTAWGYGVVINWFNERNHH